MDSVSGKMVINIAVALLVHHMLLLVREIAIFLTYNTVHENAILVFNSLYYTLFVYFGTVLMLHFAAEAVNLFVRILLVYPEIDPYVMKAALSAWSKKHCNASHMTYPYYPSNSNNSMDSCTASPT